MDVHGTVSDKHALQCEMAAEVLQSSGNLRLQVTGWSMLPSVFPGDTLIIERVHGDSVRKGEIVLYGRDRRLFVHRVIERRGHANEAAILTCGDAMPAPDRPISRDAVLGRVAYIVRNGKCIEPRKNLRLPQRAVASLVQRSQTAARIVAGVHGIRQTTTS